jgi:subtilisin family serine protease
MNIDEMKLLKRKTCLVFAILCFLSFFFMPSEPGADTPLQDNSILPYAPGELLVKFRSDIRQVASDFYRIHMGLASLPSFKHIGVQRFRLPEGLSLEEALGVFRGDPDVEYAEPNYYYHINGIPNDPLFNNLWGLRNTGQNSGTPDADIDATEAWDITTGSGSVVVAVIDSGVDYTHGDLSGNIWINTGEIGGNGIDDDGNGFVDDVRGWDFVLDRPDVSDVLGHGTHVAGTIAAMGNNLVGVSGVSWNAKIMALRFADAGGSGLTTDAISAINYANEKGAHIINLSWGGNSASQSLKDAIDASSALVVCAAGNSGLDNDTTPYYPASYSSANIIAVAATDEDDNLASFSNYGIDSVDVGAPGVNILSCRPGNGYAYEDGTSMATPHVAGLAALLQGRNLAFTPLELKAFIMNKVDPKPSLNGRVAAGGRVNAYRALEPPAAPSQLSISKTTGTQIDITWTDNASDESGFRIERKTGAGGTYSEINTTGPNTTQYSDTGLNGGTTYTYRVRAYHSLGNSGYSNEANGTTLDTPQAPTQLAVSSSTETQIQITWTDNASNETGFKIERKAASGGTYVEIQSVPADTTSHRDTGLASGTTYFYRLRAFNGLGFSVYSNEVSGTTSGLSGLAATTSSGGGGGCFIATAAYGSRMLPPVIVLSDFGDRYFRDNFLGLRATFMSLVLIVFLLRKLQKILLRRTTLSRA